MTKNDEPGFFLNAILVGLGSGFAGLILGGLLFGRMDMFEGIMCILFTAYLSMFMGAAVIGYRFLKSMGGRQPNLLLFFLVLAVEISVFLVQLYFESFFFYILTIILPPIGAVWGFKYIRRMNKEQEEEPGTESP